MERHNASKSINTEKGHHEAAGTAALKRLRSAPFQASSKRGSSEMSGALHARMPLLQGRKSATVQRACASNHTNGSNGLSSLCSVNTEMTD